MATYRKPRQIEMIIAPEPHHCRVVLDGEDISRHVYRAVIEMDARSRHGTHITIDCDGPDLGPFTIKGRLLPDPEGA